MAEVKQKRFVLDLNRCTGCGACMIGCKTENFGKQELDWREVYVFNESRHPDIPLLNISMACNHCGEPACLRNCPAMAYSKDGETGAVVHHEDRCIGCKYCTWACPYDAPRYNKEKGVVEKCDFCIQRQQEGEGPACVCACPVNALLLEEVEPGERVRQEDNPGEQVPGFTRTRLRPSIRFVPLRRGKDAPEMTAPPPPEMVDRLFEGTLKIPERKITLKSEWALLIFTTIASLLVALLAVMPPKPGSLRPFWFLGAGALGMGLSTIHLGKKTRAYRAVFHVGRSWLSREILFFFLFLALAGLYLVFFPGELKLGQAALIVGFIGLYAIDRIYQVAMQVGPANFHSAHTLLNALYLVGVMGLNILVFASFGLLKLALYLYRKMRFKKAGRDLRLLAGIFRIGLGFLLPMLYILMAGKVYHDYFWYIAAAVVAGEFIDRMEYYDELDIITPPKQIIMDIKKLLYEYRG